MIEFKSVTKIFNHETFVEKISLQANPGEVLGLLAPAPAGKTILMRMLAKIIEPDQGEILYQGLTIKKIPAKLLGYIPQVRGLYSRARVSRYLVYAGRLNHLSGKQAMDKTNLQLETHGLLSLAERRIGDLDPDLQQKITLLAAVVHAPEVLLIDEPYAGLSQDNLELIETWIREYKKKNRYVVMASRQLGKAEKICDRLCFFHQGRLLLNTSLLEIRSRTRDNVFRVEGEGDISFLKPIREIECKEEMKNVYRITLKDVSFDGRKLLTLLNKNLKVIKFEQYRPDLEDIYKGLLKTVQKRKIK